MYDGPSKFTRYSVAIVAKDIIEDDDIIECFPLENMTHIDGDINYKDILPNTCVNVDEETEVIILRKGVSIKAKWIPLLYSNRVYAPNVKKGEQVQIYRYTDTDEFFWTTMYNEFDLRRQEKVKNYYSNTGVFKEDLHDNNTYWTLIDTINKKVQLHTSDNDGELTTYDISIDTKAGNIKMEDGRGNSIVFDSAKDTLTANFKKEVVLNAPKATFNVPQFHIFGSCIKHNDRDIGHTHVHPESIGSKTSPPDPC